MRLIGSIRMLVAAMVALNSITAMPVAAVVARPPDRVGPPEFISRPPCRVVTAQPGGVGAGTAIPFPALLLGAPVTRTTTSFTTGGGGTSNAMLAAERQRKGLPYKPPTIDGESAALPATFAVDRPTEGAAYQRMPLVPSKRVVEPYGLIFAQAVSPTRGRIAALTLYLAARPSAPPRYRLTYSGPIEQGCLARTIDVYAPGMTTAAIGRLSMGWGGCSWANLAGCKTRADWPHGRVLFVASTYGSMYEYRWIDYDLLAEWRFGGAGR